MKKAFWRLKFRRDSAPAALGRPRAPSMRPESSESSAQIGSGSLYLTVKTQDYVPRDPVASAFEKWKGESGFGRVLVVTGKYGCGKSTVMAHLSASPVAKAWHVIRWNDPGSERLDIWLSRTKRQLGGSPYDGRSWPEYLASLPREQPQLVVIMVDGLDEHPAALAIAQTLGDGLKYMPSWLRLVVGSGYHPEIWESLGPDDKKEELKLDSPQELEEAMTVLLTAKNVDPSLSKRACGNWWWLWSALQEPGDTSEIPGVMVGLLRDRVERCWPTEEDFRRALPVLNIVAAGGKRGVPIWCLDDLSDVAQWVVVDRERGVVRWVDDAVMTWMEEIGWKEFLCVDLVDGHYHVAKVCLKRWESEDYATRRLVRHAVGSEHPPLMEEVRKKVVLSWVWMSRKASLDGWGGVANDANAIGQEGSYLSKILRSWMYSKKTYPADYLASYLIGVPGLEALLDEIRATLPIWPLTPGSRTSDHVEMRLGPHEKPIVAVGKFPSGLILSCDSNWTVSCWDGGSGELASRMHRGIKEHQSPEGRLDLIRRVTFMSFGRLSFPFRAHAAPNWGLLRGDTWRELYQDPTFLHRMVFLDLATLVAATHSGLNIKVWKSNQAPGAGIELAHLLEGHVNPIQCMISVPHPDFRCVVSSGDTDLRIWNIDKGYCEEVIATQHGRVSAMAVLGDGRLVTGSKDCQVRVWSRDTWTAGPSIKIKKHTTTVTCVAVFNDGVRVASGGRDSMIYIWDFSRGGALLGTLTDHSGPIADLAIMPDGRMVSGSADRTAIVWDAEAIGTNPPVSPRSLPGPLQPAHNVPKRTGDVTAALLLNDADQLVTSSPAESKIHIWNPLQEGSIPEIECVFEGHAVHCLTTVADGYVFGTMAGAVTKWTLGDCPARFQWNRPLEKLENTRINALVTMPDSVTVVGGSVRVCAWNSDTGALLYSSPSLTGGLCSLAVINDTRVAVGDGSGHILIMDPRTGVVMKQLSGHLGYVCSLRVVADGTYLLSTSVGIAGEQSFRSWCLDELEPGPESLTSNLIDVRHNHSIDDVIGNGDLVVTHKRRTHVVEIWDWKAKKKVAELLHLEDKVATSVWSPARQQLLVVGVNKGWTAYQLAVPILRAPYKPWKMRALAKSKTAGGGANSLLPLYWGEVFDIESSQDDFFTGWNSSGQYGRVLSSSVQRLGLPTCVTLTEHSPANAGGLAFETGETLQIDSILDGAWFWGHNASGDSGLIPRAYVRPTNLTRVLAHGTYVSSTQDMDVRVGDILEIDARLNDDWFQGFHEDGSQGMFPRSIVMLM